MWYHPNPFPQNLQDSLQQVMTATGSIKENIRQIKIHLSRLESITEKNEQLDLTSEIATLEAELADLAYLFKDSEIINDLNLIQSRSLTLVRRFDPREVIRKQRHSKAVEQVSWPPWNDIYDLVLNMGGDVHSASETTCSFIIPPQSRKRFLTFIASIPVFAFKGMSQNVDNSYIIEYRAFKANPYWS